MGSNKEPGMEEIELATSSIYQEYLCHCNGNNRLLPQKYKLIIQVATLMVSQKYEIAERKAIEAIANGATHGEIFEGICSSSHGWRIMH
jgi:hypothetical protein